MSADLLVEWEAIIKDMRGSLEVCVSRWYGDFRNASLVELHGFCDASQKGYGCCTYLRLIDALGHCRVILVSSQSRIAPFKPPTIPRLELQACWLLVTHIEVIFNHLSSLLPISKVYCWSDSTIAL